MTYKALRRLIKERLPDDADAILLEYSGLSMTQLLLGEAEVPEEIQRSAFTAIQQREKGVPLQYIIGHTGFYNLELYCERGVLIPRFDTETLVSEAIKRLPQYSVFADICCGSGCIAAAVLYNRPDLRAVCVDISDDALALTKRNLDKYNLSGRAETVMYDALTDWSGLPEFSSVLSNPPYIKTSVIPTLSAEVQNEPALALDGGEYGCGFYRAIIPRARAHIRAPFHILFETGYDEGDALAAMAADNGMSCERIKDLSGLDRVSVLFKN